MRNGIGFGLIPLKYRLLVLLFIVFYLQSITSLQEALISFLIGILFIILNFRLANKKLFLITTFSTFILLFLGNYLFSPKELDGVSFIFFHLNNSGFELGLYNGFRRTSQIIFGFACLDGTSLIKLSDTFIFYGSLFSKSKKLKKYIVMSFSLFPKLHMEFDVSKKSLILRSQNKKSNKLKYRIQRWNLQISSILNRIFENIGKHTYSGESHYLDSRPATSYNIALSNVNVNYKQDDKPILENLQININEGEFVYLAGANKSGKTTFIRFISGYIPKIIGWCEGSYLLGDQQVLTREMKLEKLTPTIKYITSDIFSNIIGITVMQEIMSYTEDSEKALFFLKKMGLETFVNENISSLSGGQQMRLILTCLLLSEPKVIALDDPLIQLDKEGKETFIGSFCEFQKIYQSTVIISDPNYELFKNYVDKILYFDNSSIRQLDKDSLELPLLINQNTDEEFKLISAKIMNRKKNVNDNFLFKSSNLSVFYDKGKPIVKNINLSINEGEFISVIGSNGSGKTTLFQTVAGLITTYDGEITKRTNVGFFFQNSSLQLLASTVGKELSITADLNNWSEENRIKFINHSLAWLYLNENDEVLSLHPSDQGLLSTAAMTANVGLLIIDEPTITIQGLQMIEFLKEIYYLLSKNVAVVIITHDYDIAKIADRVLFMKDGIIRDFSLEI